MKKILVAYFSASGATETVAETLAQAVGADLFEIVPAQPYTMENLNWRDKHSRSSVEMNDRFSRPAMAAKPVVAGYDVIFVGFPIWWYREPSIIDTFMESADFTGKTVVPFCTSGGSDLGKSVKNLQSLAPRARVLAGKRFSATVSAEELKRWATRF